MVGLYAMIREIFANCYECSTRLNFMRNKCNVCEETDAISLHINIYNFASTRGEQIFLKLLIYI